MSWVYILRSDDDRYYIGSTNNLDRRKRQHKGGHTRTTRVLKMHELVYSEEFDSITDARDREKQLKSYKSKKYLKWLIRNTGR